MNCFRIVFVISVFLFDGVSSDSSWGCKLRHKNIACICTNISEKEHGFQVDCSGQKLKTLPKCSTLPHNTTHLILRKNLISDIKEHSLTCLTHLRYLDVSRNALRQLHNESFSGLHSLVTLDIGYNSIGLNENNYPRRVFKPLKNVKTLIVKGNCFRVLCKKYPHEALGELSALTTLSIDPVLYVHFGTGFRRLSKLNVLDISGFHEMPGIGAIRNTSFENLENLPITILNISETHTSTIEAYSFKYLKHLNTLDLTNCDLGKRLEQAFIGLNLTAVKTLILNQTSIQEVDDSILRSLVGTRLKKITFTNNGITTVYPVFRKYLPYLESVSLEYNHITGKLSALGDLLSISTMKFINISRQNSIRGIRGNQTHDLPRIKSPPYFLLPFEPKFETFDFSYNELRIPEIPGIVFPNNTNIRHMYLSNNRIHKFAGPFKCVPNYKMKLELFDISENGCNEIPIDIFQYCDWSYMSELKLSGNNVGYILDRDSSGAFLGRMIGLRLFSMERNMVKKVNSDVFRYNPNLSHILLAENGIFNFDVKIGHLSKLRHLDLSGNLITFLPASVLEGLSSISQSSNLTINLTGNPLQCSCSDGSLNFLKWLKTNSALLVNDTHACTLSNNTKITLRDGEIERLLKWLESTCESNTLTIALSAASAVVITIVICGSIAFRYRWRITYWWYSRKHDYTPLENEYPYDVFISYGEEADGRWVVNEVIPYLENERNLRVCVHIRDFEVGKPIADNIIDFLHQSRKVMLVLSKDFLESQWCRFEVQMAYHMMVQRETDMVLLIIREKLPINLLNESLLHLIEKRTYIEWPSKVEARAAFWMRLYSAIQK